MIPFLQTLWELFTFRNPQIVSQSDQFYIKDDTLYCHNYQYKNFDAIEIQFFDTHGYPIGEPDGLESFRRNQFMHAIGPLGVTGGATVRPPKGARFACIYRFGRWDSKVIQESFYEAPELWQRKFKGKELNQPSGTTASSGLTH